MRLGEVTPVIVAAFPASLSFATLTAAFHALSMALATLVALFVFVFTLLAALFALGFLAKTLLYKKCWPGCIHSNRCIGPRYFCWRRCRWCSGCIGGSSGWCTRRIPARTRGSRSGRGHWLNRGTSGRNSDHGT
jgi:hypothetical protein